jgi:hypothetical protein
VRHELETAKAINDVSVEELFLRPRLARLLWRAMSSRM